MGRSKESDGGRTSRRTHRRSPFNHMQKRRAATYYCQPATDEDVAAGNAKRCPSCENLLTLESFYRVYANSEKRQSLCRRCHYAANRNRKSRNFGASYANQVIGQIEVADRYFIADHNIATDALGADRWDYDEFGGEMTEEDREDLEDLFHDRP